MTIRPPGSPEAVKSLAATMQALSASLRSAADAVGGLSGRCPQMGDNSATDVVQRDLAKVSNALSNAATQFGDASRQAAQLAGRIELLQVRAGQLGAQPAPTDFLASLAYEDRLAPLLREADQDRQAVDSALRASAGRTILTAGYHPRSGWDDAGDFIVGGAKAAGQMIEGVGSMVAHPATTVEGLFDLGRNLIEHPASTGAAIWDGLSDPQMREQNLPEWLGFMGVSVLSFLIPASKASDIAKLGEVGDDAADTEKLEAAAAAGHFPPSTSIRMGGITYETDEFGKVNMADVHLSELPQTGSALSRSVSLQVRGDGIEGDDAGHVIARALGGPKGAINLAPQDSNFNRGVFRAMESKITDSLKAGKQVDLQVQLQYLSGDARPDVYIVQWRETGPGIAADGGYHDEVFVNAPHGESVVP